MWPIDLVAVGCASAWVLVVCTCGMFPNTDLLANYQYQFHESSCILMNLNVVACDTPTKMMMVII